MSDARAFATTAWLCRALSPYGAVHDIPARREEWAQLLAVADHGLVLPRLARFASAHAERIPAEVQDHLASARELNRIRNVELRNQLLDLLDGLNAAGVTPCVMKGTAGLLDPEADLSQRVMLDLDIWVPDPRDQLRAIACLTEMGYAQRETCDAFAHSHHYPPFFLAGALARIELHHALVGRATSGFVDTPKAARDMVERQFDGRRFLCLANSDALLLSYVQCRWLQEDNVNLMKWFDLLDRAWAAGIAQVRGPADFGLGAGADGVDARLLTALSKLCGLPYEGAVDNGLLAAWELSYRSSFASRLLRELAGSARHPQPWRHKSAKQIGAALLHRMRDLPAILRRARSKERF